MKENVSPHLNAKESTESARDHLRRWKIRKKFLPKIGNCKYAFAEYERIVRMIIPYKDNILLVTCDLFEKKNTDKKSYEEIIDKIINVLNN